jgi:hypothetical protein
LLIVERVVNVLPQLHVTAISVYFGWVSIFMCGAFQLPDMRLAPAAGRRRTIEEPEGITNYPPSCGDKQG